MGGAPQDLQRNSTRCIASFCTIIHTDSLFTEIFDEMKQLAADFQMWLQARRRFEDSNAMTEFNRVLSYIEEEEAAQGKQNPEPL